MTSSNSVAAQNRFVYYPDHLVRMPGSGTTFWQALSMLLAEPVFKGSLYGLGRELFVPQRDLALEDESVGSLISRRFSPAMANNMVSALFHGIYAGDVHQLSARTILPLPWQAERYQQSILAYAMKCILEGYTLIPDYDAHLNQQYQGFLNDETSPQRKEKISQLGESSVFTFRKGLGELSKRLESVLASKPNVRICKRTKVNSLHLTHGDKVSYSSCNLAGVRADVVLFHELIDQKPSELGR